ncbi:hypothetical protein Tco_0541706, partial [Tanacetum coccineum]
DIFKIVSTTIHFGTARVSSVAGIAGTVTIEGV